MSSFYRVMRRKPWLSFFSICGIISIVSLYVAWIVLGYAWIEPAIGLLTTILVLGGIPTTLDFLRNPNHQREKRSAQNAINILQNRGLFFEFVESPKLVYDSAKRLRSELIDVYDEDTASVAYDAVRSIVELCYICNRALEYKNTHERNLDSELDELLRKRFYKKIEKLRKPVYSQIRRLDKEYGLSISEPLRSKI